MSGPASFAVPAAQADRFYQTAVLALRWQDAHDEKPRRLGEAASAAFRGFAGGEQQEERLILLVRNASVRHPHVFAARSVFDLFWLEVEEPFGVGFPHPESAAAWLRPTTLVPSDDALAVLAQGAELWGRAVPPSGSLPTVSLAPSTRGVGSGVSALFAVARAATSTPGVDVGAQIVWVATDPAERQLFGLLCLLTDSGSQGQVLAPAAFKDAGQTRFVGRDADPQALTVLEASGVATSTGA